MKKEIQLLNVGSLITYKDGDTERCLGDLMHFDGHGVFDPSLRRVDVSPEDAKVHNKCLDEAKLQGMDKNCAVGQCGTFYVGRDPDGKCVVRTFSGTLVSSDVSVIGRSLTFRRAGRTYRGRISAKHDMFNFRRVA